MKQLYNFIYEKLKLSQNKKFISHEDIYFPFSTIGTESDCKTIECTNNFTVDSFFNVKKFHNALVEIHKKTQYKDIIFSVNIDDKDPQYVQLLSIEKNGPVTFKLCSCLKGTPESYDARISDLYTTIHKKINNKTYLNASGWMYFIDTRLMVKKIHISWLDNKKSIAINFETTPYK